MLIFGTWSHIGTPAVDDDMISSFAMRCGLLRTYASGHLDLNSKMTLIHIFLADNDADTPFLSIPSEDIEKLSHSPHKWLKFVMFAICGAHGVLSATPGGTAVDNDTTFSNDDVQHYYYHFLQGANGVFVTQQPLNVSIGMSPNFIDYSRLNDQVTSTARTPRATDFRRHIVDRDRSCVVTTWKAPLCDAAHIIPRSKGNAVCSLLPVAYIVSALIRGFSILSKLCDPAVVSTRRRRLKYLTSMMYETECC
jgi:hypothetical protein